MADDTCKIIAGQAMGASIIASMVVGFAWMAAPAAISLILAGGRSSPVERAMREQRFSKNGVRQSAVITGPKPDLNSYEREKLASDIMHGKA